MKIIVILLSGIVSFGVLDYVWLAKIMKNFYLSALKQHVEIVNNSLVPYLPAVPLVYIVGVLSIYLFITRRVESISEAAFYGAVLGFLMYAFYDFTNLATLKGYSWSVTFVDIAWGTFVVAIVSVVMFVTKGFVA